MPGREEGFSISGESVFQGLMAVMALLLLHMLRREWQNYKSKGNGAQDRLHSAIKQDCEALKGQVRELEIAARKVRDLETEVETLRHKVAKLEAGA